MPLIEYVSRIHFEFGAIDQLSAELELLEITRPLLVTDKGIAEAGILDRVLEAAGPFIPVIHDRTAGDPNEDALQECLELWKAHDCNGVIAAGGGAVLDLAKAVSLIASHGGNIQDYDVNSGGSSCIGKVHPHIAIPTAAGTGAEVGRACVITLKNGRKCVCISLKMVANTVICDPVLTKSLPSRFTAATGIDALSHGIEALMSNVVNPPAAAIAADCISRCSRWISRATNDGSDLQARWNMMMAALEGGLCMQKSLGSAHALATPLGELGIHHGTLIGVLLPHVLRFNRRAAPDAFESIGQLVSVPGNVTAADWVGQLVLDVGLPARLSELGISQQQLPTIAERAMNVHLTRTNPRKPRARDYLAILERAW